MTTSLKASLSRAGAILRDSDWEPTASRRAKEAQRRMARNVCPLCGSEVERPIRPTQRYALDPKLAAKGWTLQDERDARKKGDNDGLLA